MPGRYLFRFEAAVGHEAERDAFRCHIRIGLVDDCPRRVVIEVREEGIGFAHAACLRDDGLRAIGEQLFVDAGTSYDPDLVWVLMRDGVEKLVDGGNLLGFRIERRSAMREDDVAAVLEVTEDDDLIMIASNGIIIRIYSGDISTFARPAKGVRVMKVGEGEKVLSVAVTEHSEEEPTEKPEEADADAGEVEPETADDANTETESKE